MCNVAVPLNYCEVYYLKNKEEKSKYKIVLKGIQRNQQSDKISFTNSVNSGVNFKVHLKCVHSREKKELKLNSATFL